MKRGNDKELKIGLTNRGMMGKIWGYSRVNNGIGEEVKCGVTKR